jgi:hypothetical protein
MFDRDSKRSAMIASNELTRLHQLIKEIDQNNVCKCKWVASKETQAIDPVERCYQLQRCLHGPTIAEINGNEDCPRERKRNNNQLACDFCLVPFCGQIARIFALATHNRVCRVWMDSTFNLIGLKIKTIHRMATMSHPKKKGSHPLMVDAHSTLKQKIKTIILLMILIVLFITMMIALIRVQ